MAACLFSSKNKSSSGERDSFTPCNMHLTPCNMKKNLARVLQCKVSGDLFRYIIIVDSLVMCMYQLGQTHVKVP